VEVTQQRPAKLRQRAQGTHRALFIFPQYSTALRDRDRLRATRGIELLEHRLHVGFHGAHRQCQLRRNGLVAHAQHHVPQDVVFAAGQRLLLHPIGYAAGDQRPERNAAQVDGAQAGSQVLQAAAE